MAGADKTNPPQEYFCPLTREIMLDPVQTADGETYERAAIEKRFEHGDITSPTTGAKLASSTLTPNKPLKRSISKFLEERAARVKDLQAKHIAAYRELRSFGRAAAAAVGDDEDWFDKGRERLRSAMVLTDAGKAEADAVAARLQQLEREQIGMHNALQQLEAAKAEGTTGNAESGGIAGSLARGIWLVVELLFTLGLLFAPLGALT